MRFSIQRPITATQPRTHGSHHDHPSPTHHGLPITHHTTHITTTFQILQYPSAWNRIRISLVFVLFCLVCVCCVVCCVVWFLSTANLFGSRNNLKSSSSTPSFQNHEFSHLQPSKKKPLLLHPNPHLQDHVTSQQWRGEAVT